MEEIEAFRYRARDAWRAVTRIAIREARLQEIKAEMLKSKQLKVKTQSLSLLLRSLLESYKCVCKVY